MTKTNIEWARNPDGSKGETWPVVTGCSHAGSPGCDMCYAARMAATRLKHHPRYEGLATIKDGRARWTGEVRLNHDVLEQPLRWKKSRMIFIASMGDLFHPTVPLDFVLSIWRIMWQAERHAFQILTKRPDRMLSFLEHLAGDTRNGKPQLFSTVKVTGSLRLNPLSNAWLGTSIENQAAADERREYLEQCPAAVKFVSYEPALGPIDWTGWEFVSQIISGGESGPGARPSHPDWHRTTRDFCQEHNIAYFFKQHGAWLPFGQKHATWDAKSAEYFQVLADHLSGTNRHLILMGSNGRQDFYRVGKKRAGHLLDGRTWQEVPPQLPS